MKKLSSAILPCIAIIGFVVGLALSPAGKVLAQSESRSGQPGESAIPAPSLRQPVPLWADQPAKCNYWSIDDIRKAHATLSAADASGKPLAGPALKDMPLQTRTHAYFIEHRAAGKMVPAESHEGASDFYVIMGGAGTMVTGGEIENRKNYAGAAGLVPGEYRGPSIKGGQTYKVKEGDWLSIPPGVPVQSVADAGGLTYLVMRINVGLYPWNLLPRP